LKPWFAQWLGDAVCSRGVIGGSRQLIDLAGLVQGSDSPTDIAISGKGFFV